MTLNTFFSTWKWPNRQTDTPTSVFDLPQGVTTIDVPPSLVSNFRDFGFELLFTNVSASDNTLTVQFFRANNSDAFAVANIVALNATVTLDATNTNNTSAVFTRDIKNLDNEHLRLVVTAPAGVTANLVVNLKVGTNAR